MATLGAPGVMSLPVQPTTVQAVGNSLAINSLMNKFRFSEESMDIRTNITLNLSLDELRAIYEVLSLAGEEEIVREGIDAPLFDSAFTALANYFGNK